MTVSTIVLAAALLKCGFTIRGTRVAANRWEWEARAEDRRAAGFLESAGAMIPGRTPEEIGLGCLRILAGRVALAEAHLRDRALPDWQTEAEWEALFDLRAEFLYLLPQRAYDAFLRIGNA